MQCQTVKQSAQVTLSNYNPAPHRHTQVMHSGAFTKPPLHQHSLNQFQFVLPILVLLCQVWRQVVPHCLHHHLPPALFMGKGTGQSYSVQSKLVEIIIPAYTVKY